MMVITLTEQDLVRLEKIETDRDEKEALAFALERIIPQVRRKQRGKMHSHLEGGKGGV
jgi:hypothetical protein